MVTPHAFIAPATFIAMRKFVTYARVLFFLVSAFTNPHLDFAGLGFLYLRSQHTRIRYFIPFFSCSIHRPTLFISLLRAWASAVDGTHPHNKLMDSFAGILSRNSSRCESFVSSKRSFPSRKFRHWPHDNTPYPSRNLS